MSPKNRNHVRKIQESFDQEGLMKTLGAQLETVEKGLVKITCAFSEGLSQQHRFFHAGVTTSIADSACGYTVLTMMPENAEVLSVEFKINLLKPVNTNKLIAVSKVLQ